MGKEITLEIFWEGPFTQEEVVSLSKTKQLTLGEIRKIKDDSERLKATRNKLWTIYAAYGSHQLYGNNVLLYIGKTTQGASVRLTQHGSWFDEERYGDTKFFVASISYFDDWEKSRDMEYKKDLKHFVSKQEPNKMDKEGDLIDRVEALLIYALAPSRNTSGKNSTSKYIRNLGLFNTGALGAFPNELSGKYWCE